MAIPVALVSALTAAGGGVLASITGLLVQFASRAGFVALGMSVVTFAGVSAGLDVFQSEFDARVGGLPSQVLAIVALTQIDTALAIIISAHVWAVTFGAAGSITGWRRGPIQ